MVPVGPCPDPVAATTRGGESGFNILRGLGVLLQDMVSGRVGVDIAYFGVEISISFMFSSSDFLLPLDLDLDLERVRGGVSQLVRLSLPGFVLVGVFSFPLLLAF